MAEALLRQRFTQRGIVATVGSAGFLVDGMPALPNAVAAMHERGLDISTHRSRVVRADMIKNADVTIAMTHHHVSDLTALAPQSVPTIFQLRELVACTETAGHRDPAQTVQEWLAVVHRTKTLGVADEQTRDIADPVGQSLIRFLQTEAELDDLLTRFADRANCNRQPARAVAPFSVSSSPS